MHRIALVPLAGLILLLGACGPSDADPGPGGVTVGEARALDEAAEMIEQRRLPPEAIATPAATESADAAAPPAPAPAPAQGE